VLQQSVLSARNVLQQCVCLARHACCSSVCLTRHVCIHAFQFLWRKWNNSVKKCCQLQAEQFSDVKWNNSVKECCQLQRLNRPDKIDIFFFTVPLLIAWEKIWKALLGFVCLILYAGLLAFYLTDTHTDTPTLCCFQLPNSTQQLYLAHPVMLVDGAQFRMQACTFLVVCMWNIYMVHRSKTITATKPPVQGLHTCMRYLCMLTHTHTHARTHTYTHVNKYTHLNTQPYTLA
jgi:hypothetical protein